MHWKISSTSLGNYQKSLESPEGRFWKLKDEKDGREPWTTSSDQYQNGNIINLTSQNPLSRKPKPNFRQLVEACRLHRGQVRNRTVQCVLNKYGFRYGQVCRKGGPSSNDIVCRYHFAKKMCKERPRDVWTSKVNFYLDGVSFYYKRNPVGQAKAP